MSIGGGIGIGKVTTLWGNQSAGKSTIATQTAAIAQSQDRGVGYFDVEKTMDKDWANRLGLDTDKCMISQISSIEEYCDISNDFIKAGVSLIVVDTSSELMPKSFFEEDGELKPFTNTGQIGQFAKEMGQANRMIQGKNYSAAILNIAQVRTGLSGFRPVKQATGGNESEHGDTVKIKLFSSNGGDNLIKGQVQYGKNLVEEHVGRKVTWSIDKNKANGIYGVGTYELYFRGDTVGIDTTGELVEYGKKYGIVEGSTWLTLYGEKIQGKANLITHLKENPEVAEKLEAEILSQAS